ncbi:MAG: hypothetical protein MUE90_10225 [Thermoanaerobaculales bacterium]|jgi:hypothetical protein|nr:hypothetical protein [Thermoanaerobaculales bacterium]
MKLLVLDPLSLLGRELLSCGDELDRLDAELEYRHTSIDDEHEIAEVGGRPVLVPPLDSPAELEGHDAVVVASEGHGSRHEHLLSFLDRNPEAAVVDLSRLAILRDHTSPAAGPGPIPARHLRVAHPALVATARVVEVLQHLGRLGGSLAAVDPVSVFGREGIEILARQAAQRMRGEPVSERIDDRIRAFNLLTVDSDALQDEAAAVLPELQLAVTHSLSGMFHGHLAHLALTCSEALSPQALREALEQAVGLELADHPLGLDTVPDHDRVLVAPAALSADGRQLALTLMVDGLRVGGALTAFELLDSLV